ncbi:coagulation factor IXb [Halichoeres trimaculatus]|uniref:coagulation factor IXb n=1 Tax=Halichoeres trimaculatus TaxID=147232 RepID=UPI003D9F41BB
MAGLCLLVFTAGLLLEIEGLPAVTTEGRSGPWFVSRQVANAVLIRQRRYNSGKLEEIYKDNLERECIEERCTMEEAREVFENDEKTMEFWATYVDGDQCKPPPCQNGAECMDGIGTYTCLCKPNFAGRNCETKLSEQCSHDNGGCAHICIMRRNTPVCKCAHGYTLGADRRSCETTDPFSCGLVGTSSTRSAAAPRSLGPANSTEPYNYSDTLPDDDISEYIWYMYEDYDLPANDSQPANITGVLKRSVRSDSGSPVDLEEGVVSGGGVTEKQQPSWAFPTIPPIIEEENTDTRIVGGDEARPGDIPWQVSLMYRTPSQDRALPFCGGSLLSELWVITAAHCVVQADMIKRAFFARMGEHDVKRDEGTEQDRQVAERHIHPDFNFTESQYDNDIALLKLDIPVELSVHRRPICLGPPKFIDELLKKSRDSLVSGWGKMVHGGLEATKLQKLQVPYVERTTCKQSSRDHVTKFMFCAGYHSKKMDACQGDSGGPHSTKSKDTWFLTGIVSWGEECAKDGKYGIYTRVSQYYQWISGKTGIRMN